MNLPVVSQVRLECSLQANLDKAKQKHKKVILLVSATGSMYSYLNGSFKIVKMLPVILIATIKTFHRSSWTWVHVKAFLKVKSSDSKQGKFFEYLNFCRTWNPSSLITWPMRTSVRGLTVRRKLIYECLISYDIPSPVPSPRRLWGQLLRQIKPEESSIAPWNRSRSMSAEARRANEINNTTTKWQRKSCGKYICTSSCPGILNKKKSVHKIPLMQIDIGWILNPM